MESFCFSHIEDELHLDFANSRLDSPSSVYVEDTISNVSLNLSAYCDGTGTTNGETLPLVVAGPAGVGKSAALANWTAARKANILPTRGLAYQECVFYHAIGCSRLSISLPSLLRRLVTSLINHFELKEPVDLADEKLPWVLPRLLERSSKKGKVVIVIDGLQHMCSHDESYGLKWLPLRLPSNVRMILSVTTPCENPLQISDHATKLQNKVRRVWDEIQRRQWPLLSMKEFEENQATAVADRFLPPDNNDDEMHRSTLMNSILSHECAKNSFFLTAVLRGVRHLNQCLDYKHNCVMQCLNWFSQCQNSHDLIECMLSVFETGCPPNPNTVPRHTLDTTATTKLGTLLGHALSLLFVARHGLREDELLDLVARVRERARWNNQTKDTVIPIKLKILRKITTSKKRLIDIFRSFDTDGNGTLSREEFYHGMARLNLKGVTYDEVTLLIDEVDNNGDGEIDFMETLDHFEDIARKYIHGGRRRSVFHDPKSLEVIKHDKAAFTDSYKQALVATLECLGVVCMNDETGRILTLPFENTTLRDVIWKKYLGSTKQETKSRLFLIEYFNKRERSLRICEELPWHLKKSNDLTGLRKLLTDLRILDAMYNTKELKHELFIYLLRLSHSKKFDIVTEYNHSVEMWYQKTNPSASNLCAMVSFLAEVMLWYNNSINKLAEGTLPPFLRAKLTDSQLHRLGIDWVKELYTSESTKNEARQIKPDANYYLLRWIWIQCPWLALKSASKAIAATPSDQESSAVESRDIDVPREIANSDSVAHSSRDIAMCKTSLGSPKAMHKIHRIDAVETRDLTLEESYAKLKEVRELYDNVKVEASERARHLEELRNSVAAKAISFDHKHRNLAASEALIEKLQHRHDQIKAMIDMATNIEKIHEQILVVLHSCQPSFQTVHLQLEQQIKLSIQQISDLRKQQDNIDEEISRIGISSKEIISQTQKALDEKQKLQPNLESLQRQVREREFERIKSERGTSFDPTAFTRRMKMEGIIARRRQMRDNNGKGAKIVINADATALHPMSKIAKAAGTWDPVLIVEKMKASEALSNDLSLRHERSELLVKKQQEVLNDLQRKIKEQHLSDVMAPNSETESAEKPLKDLELSLNTRQSSLQQITHVVKNVCIAAHHLHDLVNSIELHDEDSTRFLFAMDESKSCFYNETRDLIRNIKSIKNSTLGMETNDAMSKQQANRAPDSKRSSTIRVKILKELESDYNAVYGASSDSSDGDESWSGERDSEGDAEKLTNYVRLSRSNACENQQRRANTISQASQKHKGLILESVLQDVHHKIDSP